MTNVEKQKKVAEGMGDYLAQHIQKNLPITIGFKPYGLNFDVYGTKNKGTMQLTHRVNGVLGLQLGIFRKGTDRLYSNYLPSAPAEEMIRYLNDPASHQEWLTQIKHLSDSVDDFWK